MSKTVLVVGGGVAGLSAAVRLCDAGFRVQLLERRAILGGRAYSYQAREVGHMVDNGQHLMMGCYGATLDFLERIGSAGRVERRRFTVPLADPELGMAEFGCADLPAPFHLLFGVLMYRHLRLSERVSLLSAGGKLVLRHLRGTLGNQTVADTLADLGQGKRLRRAFWDPLVIAVLNERPEVASAALLGEVFRQVFVARAGASDLVLPRGGLSELFADPARRAIEAAAGTVQTGCRARELVFSGDRVSGLSLTGGQTVDADAVVLAVPPTALAGLLPKDLSQAPMFIAAARLSASPIVSVHLWLRQSVSVPRMLGFLDGPLHWLFTPPMQPSTGCYVTLVASGARELVEQTSEEILAVARQTLSCYLPEVAAAEWADALVVKERSATFAASPEEQGYRPPVTTPVANLFLAGDWIATGLPATIESAVESGRQAATAAHTALS